MHIQGKRWFDRKNGNTYHSVTIYIDSGSQYVPMTYGYGDAWLQTAHEWLGAHGYPDLAERHANGSPVQHTTIWLREHGHTYGVVDVARKKDL